ncbi:MAG: CidA/LrgA family protein [Nitratireductor sp.]|nr:CidA/LrgA family protein [Nitratireductor sp.]
MLNYLVLILGCQLLGELAVATFHVPVPGPVVGMVALFGLLTVLGRIPEDLSALADGLLRHLSLLFVPAGVGVMLHFKLLGSDWLAIAIPLGVSAVLTIAVTGAVMNWFAKRAKQQTGER